MEMNNLSLGARFPNSAFNSNNTKKRYHETDNDSTAFEHSFGNNELPGTQLMSRRRLSNSGSHKRFRGKQIGGSNFSLHVDEKKELNIGRILELLTKEQLTQLLVKSIEIEPKLEKFLIEESELHFFHNNGTKFKLLQEKLVKHFDKLLSQIPFERSHLVNTATESDNLKNYSDIFINDYSFEKIKSQFLDFLNLIYDYNEYALKYCALNMEIWNLLEISLKILASLPKFENKINNYYKNFLLEKLDNLLVSVLIEQSLDSDSEKSKNIEMIINMNKGKLDSLIVALGFDKLSNVKSFVDRLCGASNPDRTCESGTSKGTLNNTQTGLDYITNFLNGQKEITKYTSSQLNFQNTNQHFQNYNQNKNLSFHDSILITGMPVGEPEAANNLYTKNGSDFEGSTYNTVSKNSEFGISNPDMYFT